MTTNVAEDEFERAVVDLAHVFGWRVVGHRPLRTRDDRWVTGWKYDGEGFPDLLLLHPEQGQVVAAELKVGRNDRTDRQELWGDWFEQTTETLRGQTEASGIVGPTPVRYFLWYPADMHEITRVLSQGKASHQ